MLSDKARMRAARAQVEVPAELQQELMAAMGKAGIPVPDSPERWAKALGALKARAHARHSHCWSHARARIGGAMVCRTVSAGLYLCFS